MEVLWENSTELRHAAVRLALIEALGELHGASISLGQQGGVSLIWPMPQLA